MPRIALLVSALALVAMLPNLARADSFQVFHLTYTGPVQATGSDETDYPDAPVVTSYSDLSVPAIFLLTEVVYSYPYNSDPQFYGEGLVVFTPQYNYGSPVADLYLDYDNCEYQYSSSNCVYFNFAPSDYAGPLPAPHLSFSGDIFSSQELDGLQHYHNVQFAGDLTLATATTPEPSSFALLGTGLFGIAAFLKQRRTEGVAHP